MNAIDERLDLRLKELARREDILRIEAPLSNRITETKVEILRWSFAFWIGQVATIAALLSYMLR